MPWSECFLLVVSLFLLRSFAMCGSSKDAILLAIEVGLVFLTDNECSMHFCLRLNQVCTLALGFTLLSSFDIEMDLALIVVKNLRLLLLVVLCL